MSDLINDGGDVFPSTEFSRGISLRDHMATEFLAGIGTWMPDYRANGDRIRTPANLSNPEMLLARAEWAYQQADAMLKARHGTEVDDDA